MFILKILFAPLSLALTLFTWLCAGLISCSAFVFKLASALLSLLAVAVLITYSVKNGIILLVVAFLISPLGLPMMAVWLLGKLQGANMAMKALLNRQAHERNGLLRQAVLLCVGSEKFFKKLSKILRPTPIKSYL